MNRDVMSEREEGPDGHGPRSPDRDILVSGISGNGGPPEGVPDAGALSRSLDEHSLDEMLRIVIAAFRPGRLAVISAFGPGSLVIMHKLHELEIRLPIIFVDTLHHFAETLAHVERVRQRYDLDLRVIRAFETRAEFEARYGPELWRRDLDLYQQVSKVEPFQRATAELDGWVTGRRREQSEVRATLPLVEGGRQLRVNPLTNWNRSAVWRFILERKIPYNPLHDRDYASIGDEPLTTTVSAGEPERAGRWRGTERTECGIHEQ